ncbi:Crp/Fnr family transcriptional regulator [Mucilaginibacter sp.]|uniref:Crp/Fnr family transcriptional regulator n=1 Tax=Mucilaginibacter sp. TaxID=1882438 RepID=UPI003D0D7224
MQNLILHAYIKQVSKRIADEDLPLLASCAVSRGLKRGELLLKEGEVCREIYLVKSGYLRTYYNKEGELINLNFAFEGDFTTNLQSIRSKQKSDFTIEAGEDSLVWIFNLDKINERFNANPQVISFIRRLAIYILLASEEHSTLFKLYTPTERYRYIEKSKPQLLQRISLSQLASYLGVARETLSRIRAKKS